MVEPSWSRVSEPILAFGASVPARNPGVTPRAPHDMDLKALGDAVASLSRLDPLVKALQARSAEALEHVPVVENVLHGDPLGHALHPALVAVPIGALTTAVTLDAVDSLKPEKGLGKGADFAIALTLLSAVPTAAAGWADWVRVEDPRAKRIGLVHAGANGVALGLLGVSWILRKKGRRPAARRLALLSFGLLGASGYLGGVLSQELGVGVGKRGERT